MGSDPRLVAGSQEDRQVPPVARGRARPGADQTGDGGSRGALMSAIWDGLQGLLGGTLSFFYGLIPNFGIAVILLTILIGIILFPLTLKQTRSMKAMQEI